MSPTPQPAPAEPASGPARAPQAQPSVIVPGTGEVLERLDQLPPETLAEAYSALAAELARLDAFRKAVKAELQNRLAHRGVAVMTAGPWEIGEKVKRSSRWDGQALEVVVRDLLDAGAITHRDVQDLIDHTPKVNGTVANRLTARLVGSNKAAVEDCRTWETSRASFDVVASLPLIPE